MASSSSSSSVIIDSIYDVFLSFRGEDTRDSFTSHLYAALCRKNVKTFIDDDGLKRGVEISQVLLKAIEESTISIVIFSEHYASSKWCLDELVKILECREMNRQMVIPVFYRVNPSDVRSQTGSFKDAFVKHEERFKEMTGKVQKWRDALTVTANLSGWDSMVIRPESKLVEEIVGDILKKLNATSAPSDCQGLVEIDSKTEHIKSLSCIGSSDFQVVRVWGMGGVGNSTITEVVVNQIDDEFECCFIGNVREESEKASDGLVCLRERLLSKMLGVVNLNIGSLNDILRSLERGVQRIKIFIVLDDDMSNSGKLKILDGGIDQFGQSRVIITTLDKLLWNYEEADIYEVKKLNYRQAQNPPPDDLVMLSRKIPVYAKENPLALRVLLGSYLHNKCLGSSLYNKGKQVWESAFIKLRRTPNPEIDDAWRTSYNMLDLIQSLYKPAVLQRFAGIDEDIKNGMKSRKWNLIIQSLYKKSKLHKILTTKTINMNVIKLCGFILMSPYWKGLSKIPAPLIAEGMLAVCKNWRMRTSPISLTMTLNYAKIS